MRIYLLFILLLLAACVKPQEQIEDSKEVLPIIDDSFNETNEEIVNETAKIPYAELEKQRKRESLKNIFDFSVLTAENCDFYYSYLEKLIGQNNKDRTDLKNDLLNDQLKADEFYKNMTAAEASGDEASAHDYKDEYHTRLDRIYDIENEINDLDKKEQDLVYIRSEIKQDCIFLKKEKGLNTIRP